MNKWFSLILIHIILPIVYILSDVYVIWELCEKSEW